MRLAAWSRTFLKCIHRRGAYCSLIASFNFACWVAELVKMPRTNFGPEFGFAGRRAFFGMGQLARPALEYV
jgi:hypothetical protein